MSEKRMLIVDTELLDRIDENRGDMSRSDFVNFLIESKLAEDGGKPGAAAKQNYVTREELAQSMQGIKELLHSFLEFFINYGLEVGKPDNKNFDEMVKKLWTPENKAKHP